jgi:MmyB-like transcription regulator ligand binding domain
LLSEPARHLFVDWEAVARGAIATFRADCTQYIGNAAFETLVVRLTRLSPEFAAWWPQRDVAHRLAGRKRLSHPTVGSMCFDFSMLAIGGRPGMKLCIFTAIDEEGTPQKLSRLLGQPQRVA